MAKPKDPVNPFYVLLVVVGVAFSLTACAYGVMLFRDTRPATRGAPEMPSSLLDFMDRYGGKLLTAELALLAISTVGAIATDGYWSARRRKSAVTEQQTSRSAAGNSGEIVDRAHATLERNDP